MRDEDKSKVQLVAELVQLRQQLAAQQAELARSLQFEADQHQITGSLPVLVATAGLDGFYHDVNAAFARILGWSERESLSRPFLEFIHPEDRAEAAGVFERLRSGETVTNFVDRNLCRDGSHRWINWNVIPLLDRGIVFGIGQDITAQRLADERRHRAEAEAFQAKADLERRVRERTAELSESNARLQAEVVQRCEAEKELAVFQRFAEAATQGFGMATLDGHITYANPTLTHLFGAQTAEEVIGRSVWSYYPGNYRALRENEILPALRRGEAWQGELMMVFPDGQLHPTINTIFPVYDEAGQLFRTAATITDITEAKQAEDALRQSYAALAESEAKYRQLIETTDTGFAILDPQGRVLDANPEYVRISGHSDVQEIVGQSVSQWTAPHDQVPNAAAIERCLADGQVQQLELDCLHPDGTIVPVEINASVVQTQQGTRILALCRDITERKQSRAALCRLLEISDRDRESITRQLHDSIVQPMLGALLQLETYEQESGQLSAKARRAFCEALQVLRDVAAAARRLRNRAKTPVLDRFGVAAAIADFIDQFDDDPAAPEVTYRCDVRFKRLEHFLETAIFYVAQEAIMNACLHSGSDLVRVALVQNGDTVTLDVDDTGIGFDLETVNGKGLGLHSIRERARLLGNNLRIESRPGQGTRIQITFPLTGPHG
jgi:PAS domain S-box-containing protein